MKNDKYGKKYGYIRIPLEAIGAGDTILFTDSRMTVNWREGDEVSLCDAGWTRDKRWTMAAMKERKMKAYRKGETLCIVCRECGAVVSVVVLQADYERWQRREGYIQDIFPYLSADEREMMMSRICGKCFDALFAPAC